MASRPARGSDANSTVAALREWLASLGGPTAPAIPPLSESSLAYLKKLSAASKARDGMERRLAAETRRQAAVQEAEAARAAAVLERCSLHIDR